MKELAVVQKYEVEIWHPDLREGAVERYRRDVERRVGYTSDCKLVPFELAKELEAAGRRLRELTDNKVNAYAPIL